MVCDNMVVVDELRNLENQKRWRLENMREIVHLKSWIRKKKLENKSIH